MALRAKFRRVPASSLQTAWVDFFVSVSPAGGESIARFFSALGSEWFYLFLIPLLLWRGPWETAIKVARVMVLTDLVGEAIKWTLRWPRPPQALVDEPSPGFVSTHAALSLAVALILARSGSGKWRLWLIPWVLGVAWSRLRLGVHFPLDILGGWAVGALMAGVVERWGGDKRSACYLSLGFGLLLATFWPESGGESLQRDLGLLLGLEFGLLWRLAGRSEAPAPPPLSWSTVLLRLVGLLGLYVGLKTGGVPRLIRYLALGLWSSWRAKE